MPDLGSPLNRMYNETSAANNPTTQGTRKQTVNDAKSRMKAIVEDFVARVKAYYGEALYAYRALSQKDDKSGLINQVLAFGVGGLFAIGAAFYLYRWVRQD